MARVAQFLTTVAMAALVAVSYSSLSKAGTITSQTFDSDPPLGASEAPGVWFPDRFPPAEFTSESFMGDQRLKLGLSANDGRDERPGGQDSVFYDTQGRTFLTPDAQRTSIDFFIDSAWEDIAPPDVRSSDERIGGFWTIGLDASGDRSAFPIIEFFDNEFQVFDSVDAGNGTGFIPVGSPSDFGGSFDEFFNLSISLDNGTANFAINNMAATSLDVGATTELGATIIQGVNTAEGIDRDLYFDNFQAVPLPGTYSMLGIGLATLMLVGRVRRKTA